MFLFMYILDIEKDRGNRREEGRNNYYYSINRTLRKYIVIYCPSIRFYLDR